MICTQDVYKTIGYTAPFPVSEKEEILEKLNKYTEEELAQYVAKKNAKAISAHRKKNGEFTCVEQLLGK